MTGLAEAETTIAHAAAEVGPSVVGLGRGWGVGSGVVIAPGRVLTNAHNLRGEEVTITFAGEGPGERLGDGPGEGSGANGGRRESGRVLGADPDLDIAVIEVSTGDVAPVHWAQSEAAPAIGQTVLALANPGGRGLRVTLGFISSTARSFRGPRGRRIGGAIEHSAPLPRGSSGGPLLGRAGNLLGINSVRVDGGLILAIPADAALRERIEALARGEAPTRLRLGVAIAPPRVARRLRRAVGLPERDGVLVRAVEDGSAADRAGVQRGDLIVAAAGRAIDGTDVLYDALDQAAADAPLELTIVRGTDERPVQIEAQGAR